jgi:hypothetical protein
VLVLGRKHHCLPDVAQASVAAFSGVAFVATMLVAAWSRAAEPVRFEYRAPEGCPDESAFVEQVRARSLYQRLAAEGELARTFVVAITVDRSGATARVDFVDVDGSAAFRQVRGATCAEAASGIALVCALAIDGRATPDEPVASAPPFAAQSGPAATPLASATRVDAPAPGPPGASPSRVPSTPTFSVGLGAGYASHAGPSGAPSIDAFVGARRADDGPSARVSAWHFWSDARSSSGREARFRGYGLRLEGCPIAFGSAWWFAEPCLATDGGVLLASAVESEAVPEPHDSTQGYWDVVAVARVGSVFSRFFVLELQGELVVPLVHYSYGFGDPPVEPDVYEMPAAGVGVRGAVGFRFP